MDDLVQRHCYGLGLQHHKVLPRYIDTCIWAFGIFAFMLWLKYCEICIWQHIAYFSSVHKLIA